MNMFRFSSRAFQKGFTLIEIILGMAICGVLGGGVITAMYQLSTTNSIDNAHSLAITQMENTVYHINRDMQMAQTVDNSIESGIVTLTLKWTTWDSIQNIQVQYIWTPGQHTISRSYSVNNGAATTTIVGKYIQNFSITMPNTSAVPPETAWTLSVSANATSGNKQIAETRLFKILPRPKS
jgi:prepilin-type N-terminal cleavage/methylation domain-containing protein